MSDSNLCKQIIDFELIQIYMQAILSHHDEFSLGVEAFVKGVHPSTGEEISPVDLFIAAKKRKFVRRTRLNDYHQSH